MLLRVEPLAEITPDQNTGPPGFCIAESPKHEKIVEQAAVRFGIQPTLPRSSFEQIGRALGLR